MQPQVSFLNGAPCKHGTPGSIRVDNFVDGLVAGEMKNYDLTAHQGGLVKDIVSQATKNHQHLPPEARQVFTVDARGQVCTPEMREAIRSAVVRRSRGILTDTDIRFW